MALDLRETHPLPVAALPQATPPPPSGQPRSGASSACIGTRRPQAPDAWPANSTAVMLVQPGIVHAFRASAPRPNARKVAETIQSLDILLAFPTTPGASVSLESARRQTGAFWDLMRGFSHEDRVVDRLLELVCRLAESPAGKNALLEADAVKHAVALLSRAACVARGATLLIALLIDEASDADKILVRDALTSREHVWREPRTLDRWENRRWRESGAFASEEEFGHWLRNTDWVAVNWHVQLARSLESQIIRATARRSPLTEAHAEMTRLSSEHALLLRTLDGLSAALEATAHIEPVDLTGVSPPAA